MTLLTEVGTLIASLSTSFTVATNVWYSGFPPDTADTAISIFETGGLPPRNRLGSTAPAFEYPGLQIVSRSSSYATARANAQTIWNSLNAQANSTNSGTRYLDIQPQQSPFDIGQDAEERKLVACNYLVRKEVS